MYSFSKHLLLIFYFISIGFLSEIYCQSLDIECNKDTVLTLGDKKLCEFKNYLNRKDILDTESFLVNHNEFKVYSYNVSSFTLGNNMDINVNGELIPLELKQAIISTEIQYKFINLNNILLADNKNNIVKPSLQNIKIIFLD